MAPDHLGTQIRPKAATSFLVANPSAFDDKSLEKRHVKRMRDHEARRRFGLCSARR
jgi:hypothetical protein